MQKVHYSIHIKGSENYETNDKDHYRAGNFSRIHNDVRYHVFVNVNQKVYKVLLLFGINAKTESDSNHIKCSDLQYTYSITSNNHNRSKRNRCRIILPDGIPTEFFVKSIEIEAKPKPISDLMALQNFLISDTTDHHEYIPSGEDMYICVHFATDLAQNLTDAGYYSGIVVRSAKWHNKGCGHLLTWCKIENDLFVIEAGNDDIYCSDYFNASIDHEIYVMRYESLASGYRKCNEMYRRR